MLTLPLFSDSSRRKTDCLGTLVFSDCPLHGARNPHHHHVCQYRYHYVENPTTEESFYNGKKIKLDVYFGGGGVR